MDRLLRRIRDALADGPRRPLPLIPDPVEPPDVTTMAETFALALERVGGTLLRIGSFAEARAWITRRPEDPAELGVDIADLLIAETGTVVRTFEDREASRSSLHPAVSIFLARPDSLVPDLPAALRRLHAVHSGGRACTVFITGPSRTADIEKEPVTPAHGPRELIVLLSAESEETEGAAAP